MCGGLEVLVGAVCDKYFGPVIVVGLGGIYAELLKDTVRRFAPFPPTVAKGMLMQLKASAILTGYRNRPPLDTDALAITISQISYLIYHHQDRIREIDINPLFVREKGKGVVAADALIVLNTESSQANSA
jgi:acetyltransferase